MAIGVDLVAFAGPARWPGLSSEAVQLSETVGDDGFPGALFPALTISGDLVIYAAANSLSEWRKLQPLLLAFAGPTLTDFTGAPSLVADYERRLYGDWIDVARSHADFFGVQCYTRLRFDDHGMAAPPQGAELTLSGYEFYPQALANTIRWAHRTIGKPIYVTESGVAVADDARRIAFIDRALDGVRECLDEGISVHSYIYWSLLDNFEWTSGYAVPFGLAAVDRQSFKRTPRPSAFHFAAIARAKGFLLVAATPLTRSSYHAGDDFAKMKAARELKLAAKPAATAS